MPTIPKQDADSLALMACKSVDFSEKVMTVIAEHFSRAVANQMQQAVRKSLLSVGADGVLFMEYDSLATMLQFSWTELADEVITTVTLHARDCTDDAELDLKIALHALRSTADRIETECRKVLPAPAV